MRQFIKRTLVVLIVILLFCAVLAGSHLLIDEKGYVLVSFGQYTIESTLVSLLFIAVITVFVMWLTTKLAKTVWRVIRGVTARRTKKRQQREEDAFTQSVWALINNQPDSLGYTLQLSEFPEKWRDQQLAIQAKAALHIGQKVVAREYLQQLSESAQSKVSELWLAAEQDTQALTSLAPQAQMKKASPTELNAYVSALLQAKDWDTLQSTIEQRHKQLQWSGTQWSQFFAAYFEAILRHSDKDIHALYGAFPRALRGQSHEAYVHACVRFGHIEVVRKELLKMLKKSQYQELATILQYAGGGDIELRKAIQAQLKKQPDQTELLFCLASLANGEGDHGLAAKIFDSLSSAPWQALWQHQAEIAFAKTGQFEKAYLLVSNVQN
ncbi:hypothetical protein N474_08335 [Pseudoalteromonas luteoviolacea CPMOR-2]|uniref:heme biosynthesis HemY N-terminal domain-containing protein n=1 Tax=Pseudoalteromonas luteoviolacea TaxID=43657 RepID=UPI0007B0BB5B|nr:heme biosynthesis HemY N-terminal domain-containing protein [Pseudoalteromonas luteoviolacea]KZN57199.1 hypothetical protein N474_08335 [Pseudoalteromonas luteoviolacea CPMOR-2]